MQAPNKIPADIVFIIRDKPHPHFKYDLDNLEHDDTGDGFSSNGGGQAMILLLIVMPMVIVMKIQSVYLSRERVA